MNRRERRQSPRGNSRVPLDLYDLKGRVLIGEGRFVNVSLTGSLLESRQSLALHQPIRLQLQAPGKPPAFAGEVIWRKRKNTTKYYYGIRFKPMSLSTAFSRPPVAAYIHAGRSA
jgi:hypothetical protein